ncbi:hypothetical protein [Mycolicibacterium austroafricanum]|uniref:hypothetical protein n=1 Tax=Mycolicibacterium austroafricanum TaxID=39687 RepID=UPI001CA33B57|nr:hypothetical protein [Mycolicibacterium austroafricanum]QZT54604.1 hypothetical protein JN084_16260 [Mycolicibacterium austroafricanum]
MTAANDDKDATAEMLYKQIRKELEKAMEHPDTNYRMGKLADCARLYAIVAEVPGR